MLTANITSQIIDLIGWTRVLYVRHARHVLKPGTPEHPGTPEQPETPEHPGTPEYPGTNYIHWHFIFFTWCVIGKQNNTVKFNSVFRGVPAFLLLIHAGTHWSTFVVWRTREISMCKGLMITRADNSKSFIPCLFFKTIRVNQVARCFPHPYCGRWTRWNCHKILMQNYISEWRFFGVAGMVQWWEPSPLTNVTRGLLLVLFSAPRGFSPGTPVFRSSKNQHF